jgi:hypothetical protein
MASVDDEPERPGGLDRMGLAWTAGVVAHFMDTPLTDVAYCQWRRGPEAVPALMRDTGPGRATVRPSEH